MNSIRDWNPLLPVRVYLQGTLCHRHRRRGASQKEPWVGRMNTGSREVAERKRPRGTCLVQTPSRRFLPFSASANAYARPAGPPKRHS